VRRALKSQRVFVGADFSEGLKGGAESGEIDTVTAFVDLNGVTSA
jgi:hypothetical protein